MPDNHEPERRRRRWPLVVATFFVTLAAFLGYVASMPVRYASDAVVAFQPQQGRAGSQELISLLVQTYPKLVKSDAVMSRAAGAAGVPTSALQDAVGAQIPPLTLTMTVRTELATSRQAQTANQELVDQVVAQGNADPYVSATAISKADLQDRPAGPPRWVLYLVAVVLAAASALMVGVIAAHVSGARANGR